MDDYIVRLENVTKTYEDGFTVLDNLNLAVRRNEFLTLLGPSGCGKTTTLRIIAGFMNATSGDVFFENKRINDIPPHKRNLNTVFQSYALFTHMNVFDNVAFGLKIKGVKKSEIDSRVKEALKTVNLSGYEKRDVGSLSGGQQQRIAIARAVVNEPALLLLDEPLGALDLKMRQSMQYELKAMQKRLGISFVYVTHDQEEALTMSDYIAVMKDGVVQQYGTPVDIYNEPKNAFVAKFIGESNIVDGIMHNDFDVEYGGKRFKCVDGGFEKDEPVEVVIRPEDIEVTSPRDDLICGTVRTAIFKGVHYEMIVDGNDGNSWLIHSTVLSPEGSKIGMAVTPDNIHIMKKS